MKGTENLVENDSTIKVVDRVLGLVFETALNRVTYHGNQ